MNKTWNYDEGFSFGMWSCTIPFQRNFVFCIVWLYTLTYNTIKRYLTINKVLAVISK